MRNIRIVTKLLVLLMAIYGLSLLQPTASATKRSTAVDDPCHCGDEQLTRLENASTDQENCTGGATAQYENCLTNAEMVAEEQFWGCWEWHNYDEFYGDWCDRAAQQTYQAFAGECDNAYFDYVLPFCFSQYAAQVEAASEAYQFCICNCPYLEEWEKAGYGC
jgi:hypothetical protein